MKNQKSRKLSYVLVVAMLFTSVTLSAQQARRGDGEHHHPHMERNESGQKGVQQRGTGRPHIPDLTEEQKEQLHGFKVEMDKKALPLQNELGEKEARLRTLTTSESYNASAVEDLIEELGEVKTELEKLKVGQIQKIKSILTEEQLVAFNKQVASGHKKRPRRG